LFPPAKPKLTSLKKLNYPNYEVILVDNASDENPENSIKSQFPEVVFLRSGVNLGFAGGNNLGIEVSKGDYLFLVNNDTEVTPDLIKELVTPFSNKEIGVVCPKIKYFDNPDIIQYAGFTKVNPLSGRNKAIGNNELDRDQYNQPKYTSYAHGAAMMVRRSVIDQVGMMPENFFLYYEELDWSASIVNAGYKILFQPKGVIYHKESVSIGKESPVKTYYLNRNRILFMRRNSTGIQLFCFIMFLILFTIPKNTLVYLVKGQFDQMNSFFRGILWNINGPKNSITTI
jgi:hypothetical protein